MISRDTLMKVCNLLGWEPSDVLSLQIWPTEVYATLFARDEDGNRIVLSTEPLDYAKRTEVVKVAW